MPQPVLDYDSSAHHVSAAVWLRLAKRSIPYVAAMLVLYVGTYICLSVSGRYIPSEIGPGADGKMHAKWYYWAPAGIFTGFRLHPSLLYFYAPLWTADRAYWHCDGYSFMTGRYPTSKPVNRAEWTEWYGR